jgi:hypothetical protein
VKLERWERNQMSPMAPGEADWGNFGKSFAQLAETNAASNPIGALGG